MLSRRTSASRTRLTHAQQRRHAPIMLTRRLDSRLQVERRQTDLRQHNRRRRRRQLRRWRCRRLRHKVPSIFLLHLRFFRHWCYIQRFVPKLSTVFLLHLHLRSFKNWYYIRRLVSRLSTASGSSHITSDIRHFVPKLSTASTHITSNIRRFILSLSTAPSHIASNITSLRSSCTPLHRLPLPIPAVLIQKISHTLHAKIHIKPLPDRRRGIRKVSIRPLVEELEHPL